MLVRGMWGHDVATWQKVRVSHFRFGRAKADLLRYEVQSRSGKKWFRAASMSGSATSLLTKLHGSCRSFSLWPLCCCLLCGFVMFTQKPMSSLFLWRPLLQPRILQRSLEWVMWWLPVGRYRLYDTLTGLQQHLWCFLSSVWLEEQRHSVQKRLPREVDFAFFFFLWRLIWYVSIHLEPPKMEKWSKSLSNPLWLQTLTPTKRKPTTLTLQTSDELSMISQQGWLGTGRAQRFSSSAATWLCLEEALSVPRWCQRRR